MAEAETALVGPEALALVNTDQVLLLHTRLCNGGAFVTKAKLMFLTTACHFLAGFGYARQDRYELRDFQEVVFAVKSNKPSLSIPSCDLSMLTAPLPKVILVGESHWGSLSSESAKSVLLEEAAQNSFPLLIEVLPSWDTLAGQSAALPWLIDDRDFTPPEFSSPNIEGIEAFVPKSVIEVDSVLKQIRSNPDGKLGVLTGSVIGTNLIINPIFRVAFDSIKTNQPALCSECIDLFDQTLQNSIIDGYKRYSNGWNMSLDKRSSNIAENQYRAFVSLLHEKIIEIANEWLGSESPGFAIPNHSLSVEEVETVTILLRDKYFAFSAADLICRRRTSNFIVVLVGDKHTPGMRANLDKLSKGRLQIQYYRSYDQEEAQALFDSLNRPNNGQ